MSDKKSTTTYVVTKKCNNCGFDGEHRIEKGTLVKDATCNSCGCKGLGGLTLAAGLPSVRDWPNLEPKTKIVC